MALSNKPSFSEALKFWLKLGFISFGGPAGQVAIMHEFVVVKKKWISESKFLHALNYCMILPGPEAQQLATYIGWLLHGTIGGLVAGILFVLPSMFILTLLSIVYVYFGHIPWMHGLFDGLKPAVIAIVILALIKIAQKSLLTPIHYAIAFFAWAAVFIFSVPFPLIIVASVLIALLFKKTFPQYYAQSTKKNIAEQNTDESAYFINKDSKIIDAPFSAGRLAKQIVVAILLWTTPFALFYALSSDASFWNTLSLFFTKAALVTFGGAYAVLPYVAQVSVEKFHWLSNMQMIDGLALGETTPGPLIMVLAFVGYMAAYNHFTHSILLGIVGLVVTVYYTFIPSFLFILIGAPIVEKTQENKSIKELLSYVSAAVVGVIFNLTLYLGKAVVFPRELTISSANYVSLLCIFISIAALYKFKVNMILWIGISALMGVAYYSFS